MSRSVFRNPARASAKLLTGLLMAVFALASQAQPATGTQRPVMRAYDRAHEVTLNATIQTVVTKPGRGMPAGMHLIVAGPQGITDAHVGPYLSAATKAALQSGAALQMVGATETVRGRSFFLVRQIVINGRTINVRSTSGALIRGAGVTPAAIKARLNGGAR